MDASLVGCDELYRFLYVLYGAQLVVDAVYLACRNSRCGNIYRFEEYGKVRYH